LNNLEHERYYLDGKKLPITRAATWMAMVDAVILTLL